MQELGPLFEWHRPRIVFDCSQVRSIDSAGVEMLLHCLEEAMKRDGDLNWLRSPPKLKSFLNSCGWRVCLRLSLLLMKLSGVSMRCQPTPFHKIRPGIRSLWRSGNAQAS